MKTPSKEEAAALALVPPTLTSDENKLLQRYRATAPYWRADIVDFANMVAKMFPLEREPAPAGHIKLVSDDGGAK
ncbi:MULTISPECIES: hypothetical protein [Duganella]|uniref:Uncharacterized protein n=2 Tax=Duganella TaxID=75654 RepID=A0A7X4KG37_9BURK|nr:MULTISPECIES: hypothetical protein [Duganella]MYM72144.1 hypothetical protein [Duganella margarita]MYN30328.1 hypothetical protein [Duganella levis]